MDDHDAFYRYLCGAPSPVKASKQAASHIVGASRRGQLGSLLDKLERHALGHMSPQKIRGRRKPKEFCVESSLPPPPLPLNLKRVKEFRSTSEDVVELYEAYVTRREIDAARASSGAREKDAVVATAKSKEKPLPGTFSETLKLYYPYFSRETLDLMIADAKPGMDAIDRRAFIALAKGTYTDRLNLAFERADKDGSGGLSIDEFSAAVQATGAQPPGRSASYPISERDLKDLFLAADADGNGVVDLDEFLDMCAHHPWLVKAFDRIVELGVKRKLKAEEMRLLQIFRHPVSPLSRCIRSPKGSKFRPGLFDLRTVNEIGDAISRADRKS